MMIQCYGGTEEKQPPMRRKATFKILKDGNIEQQFDIDGIPNTTLKFKTDDPAPFIMIISITQIYQYLARIMGETTNEKSHYELLRDEILVHRKFYDETGKRVERKTLDEFEKWRKGQEQKENKQPDAKQDVEREERQGIKLTCDSCGFSWNYKGKKAIARCPNCNHRIYLKPITGGGGGGV